MLHPSQAYALLPYARVMDAPHVVVAVGSMSQCCGGRVCDHICFTIIIPTESRSISAFQSPTQGEIEASLVVLVVLQEGYGR